MKPADTITTADGRMISLSELRDIAIAERDGDLIAPSTPAYLKFRQLFDAEACLALVDEIRRQNENIADLTEKLQFSEGYRELDCRSIQIKNDTIATLQDEIRRLRASVGAGSATTLCERYFVEHAKEVYDAACKTHAEDVSDLNDEIRRLRERVAELESGLVDADNALDACIDVIESVVHEDAAPLVATKMHERIAELTKGSP